MATIKSFTDISQSKVLAEILPLESADMYYDRGGLPSLIDKYVTHESIKNDKYQHLIPCWSLAALLDILPDRTCVYKKTYKDRRVKYQGIAEGIKELILKDNPIDVCYEMVIRLNELNLL